jgi:hypothetical protein
VLKYFGKLQTFVYSNFTRFGKKYRVQLRGEPGTAKCAVLSDTTAFAFTLMAQQIT